MSTAELPSSSTSPLTNPKIPTGLSTFFNSSIRRSRSLASLQKLAAEDLRSPSALSVHQEEPERRPKLKTSKTSILDSESKSVGKKWMMTPIVSTTSVFAHNMRSKDGIRTPSPPARPAPAPHLWNDEEMVDFRKVHKRKDSLAGLETTIAPCDTSPLSMNPPTPYMCNSATMSPRAQSPLSKSSPRSARENRGLAQRRKPSVADLTIGSTMSTVQEHDPITATIPEQPETRSSRESLTPRAFASDPQLASLADSMRTPTASHKSYRRSSMLLPGSLAPLLIPNSPKLPTPTTMLLPATTYSGKSPIELSASPMTFKSPDDERPPEVPPKSPRTLNRAFPVPRTCAAAPPVPPIQNNISYHKANSSVTSAGYTPISPSTASHTANSSVTSFSPSELSSQPWSPKQILCSSPQQESSSAPAVVTSPLPWTMSQQGRTISPRRPLHNQNNFSIDDTVSKNSHLVKAASTANLHQRNISDSVINRGRPMKRGETSVSRTASRERKLSGLNKAISPVLQGFSRASVMAAITQDELVNLRQNAEMQATGFETLPSQMVEDLTKEMHLLEDHCTTLRRTAMSLREARKSLHERLVSFLKAPANAYIARDHIVQQEAALTDLDTNIDEYTSRLELMQDRKSKVQRKLLEHVGAVLSLCISGNRNAPSEEQTPPRSPVTANTEQWEQQKHAWQQQALVEQRKRESEERREQLRQIAEMEREQEELEEIRRARSNSEAMRSMEQNDGQGSPRASAESIRIYADSGVASLLASIEKEIDAMDEMRTA